MPIGPEEAYKVNEYDEKVMELIQGFVDENLKEEYDGLQIAVDISTILPEGFTLKQRAMDEIVKNYKSAGWKQAYFSKNKFNLSPLSPSDWDK
ncbi:hypothetical protein D3C81_687930 [compost metagenome]